MFQELNKGSVNLNLANMKRLNIGEKCSDLTVCNSLSLLCMADAKAYSLCYLDKNSHLGCILFDSSNARVICSSERWRLIRDAKIDYFKQVEFNGHILIYVHKLEHDSSSYFGIDELLLFERETLTLLGRYNSDYYLNEMAANSQSVFCLNFQRELFALDGELRERRGDCRKQLSLASESIPLVTIQMEANDNDCLFFLYSECLYSFKVRIVRAESGQVLHDLPVYGDQFKFLTNDLFVVYCDFKKRLHLFNWEDERNASSISEEEYEIVDDNKTLVSAGRNGLRLVKGKSANVAFMDVANFFVYF